MKCHEHNRSKKWTLRGKNLDPTSTTVPPEKDYICSRRQMAPQGIYLHYGFNSFKKKKPHQIAKITVFIFSKTERPLSVIILGEMADSAQKTLKHKC